MNIFIAQPMTGLSNESIENTRNGLIKLCQSEYGEKINILDQFHLPDDIPEDYKCSIEKQIYLLGRSIQILAKADVAYFADGWENYRGCRMENNACLKYGVKVIPHQIRQWAD